MQQALEQLTHLRTELAQCIRQHASFIGCQVRMNSGQGLRLKMVEKQGKELVEHLQLLVMLDQGGAQAGAKGIPILDAELLDGVKSIGALRQADPDASRP